MEISKKYIVKSGNGYIIDSKSLEMISHNSKNKLIQSSIQLLAQRMSFEEANIVCDKLEDMGLEANLIEIKIGKYK